MFVALLRRQSVSVYRKESLTPVVVNFPANLVANLEVKEAKGLTDYLTGFLKSAEIPAGEGILLLSSEVNFAKDFPNDNSEQTLEAVRSFLGLVPISKSDFVSKEFVVDNKKWVCVSNRTYCISMIYGFQRAGLKITMVLPVFVVGVDEQTVFGVESFARIEMGLSADRPFSMLPSIFAGEKKEWWKFW